MRFTRRRPNMDFGKLLALAVPASLAAAVGCFSSDEADLAVPPPPVSDASSDGGSSVGHDAGESPDPTSDAGFGDVEPLPIECASPPCATALVTTFPGRYGVTGEGFCAVLADGTVACWGANHSGQLGRGEAGASVFSSSTPERVLGLERIVELEHMCALDEDGAVWCWGYAPLLRDTEWWMPTVERTPVRLDLPPAAHVGFAPSVGCIATRDGALLCWGSNDTGQLPTTGQQYQFFGVTEIELPPGPPIRRIAVGNATFFIREDGSALSVGAGQAIARLSSLFNDPNPGRIELDGVRALDVVDTNVCATARGVGYCWGDKLPGALDAYGRAFPRGLVLPEPIVDIATTPVFTKVDGEDIPFRWCAVSVSGAVYCWGFNRNGQAGTGTKEYVNDAARVVGLPAPAVSVKTTLSTTCALLTTGKVYCWGGNYDGQLGNGQTRGMALVPEEVILP